MEKNIEIGLLYEFYGNLLTDKQSYIIDSYYNDDLSLAEIANEIEISRQGVRKQLKDSENILYNYEKKIGLMNKFLNNKIELKKIYKKLEKLEEKYNDKLIIDIKNKVEKLI